MKKKSVNYWDATPESAPQQETAAELITRMEKECHCRVDDNNYDNMAVNGLLGHLARVMGQSSHIPHDDVVAGTLMRFEMSPEGKRKREADKLLGQMLAAGMSPDEVQALFGKKA